MTAKILFLLLSISIMNPVWGKSHTESDLLHLIPQLENHINNTMKGQKIPGMAVAIVSKDKVHYIKTFGVKYIGKPDKINPTTVFQVASLSKPINATLIGILHDKGKLTVDDPVSRFIPHFNLHNNGKPVKICHLMSHSTGITSNGFNEMIEAFAPRQNIIDKMQKRRAVAAPGKHFAYHNAMYGVIEDVITRTEGKPLDQIIKKELFEPLGMRTACVGLGSLLASPDRAYPHIPNGKGRYMPAPQYSKAYYAFRSAGGVNASIMDLIPFLQLYVGKNSPIVSRNSLKQLTNPFVKNPKAVIMNEVRKGKITNTYYGLGWQSMNYNGYKVVYHQGHLKGFRHFMGYVEDDVGIIILTNAERKHASKIALKFFDLYLH